MTVQTVPSAGQYGVIADAAPQELPDNAWSYSYNVRFRNGYAEQFRGETQIFTTPAVVPYWIASYRAGNSKYFVHAGIARVYVDDGATRTDLTPLTAFTGAIDNRWTGGSASGVMVINNGIDQPQFWGGNVATPFATLTGWNSLWRCASLRPFKNYLIALDVTKSATRYGNMVKWSSAAVPGSLPPSWDETDATKDAGEIDLAETPDLLVDQLQLGDINVIYKERSMYGMQYIGAPFVWRFFRLPGDVGMLTRGCAVNTPKGHVVLTSNDLIVHNGQGAQSIVEGRMRKWLFNSIDSANFQRSFLVTNQLKNEVWVCFPESGQSACSLALVWNWADDVFSIRQLANVTYGALGPVLTNTMATWASDTGTWNTDTTTWNNDGFGALENRLLLASSAPSILLTETGAQINGANPIVTLERVGMAFGEPDVVKTIKSITPRLDATAGTVMQVQIGGSMDAEKYPMWQLSAPYTAGTSRKFDSFATGRFLSVRLTSNQPTPWRLKSFDIDVNKTGRY